jgi:hypothetical protein
VCPSDRTSDRTLALASLDNLDARTDEVKAEITRELKALVAFTAAITDLLSAEHNEWL